MFEHLVSEVSGSTQGPQMNTEQPWLPPARIDRHLSVAIRWSLLAGLVFLVAVFYVFTYNSGYGYDSLEYLVIGRAVSNGMPFYSLIPSKSPGIYYLIAMLFSLGLPRSHGAISVVIALFFAATLLSTWLVARHFFGYRVAVVATLLVAACAIFMEMNFLEPESLVFLCGLAAFALVLRSLRTNALGPLLVAGIALALGFQFKSVAAFYCLGIVAFLVLRLIRQHFGLGDLLRQGAALTIAFLFGCSVPFLLFASAGKAADFWLWTIKFPLLYYPANTLWLDKLFTKLLWFHLLLLVSIISSLIVRSRRTVWNNDAAALAFFMGLASYLALLKTQASHYCFPGAAFFSIFIAATLLMSSKREARVKANRRRPLIVAGAAALLLITVSAVSYRPRAVSRFLEWRSFDNERVIGESLRQQLDPGQKALFVRSSTFLYWVSDVEPAARFIYFDTQTTYFVEHNPDALLNVLKDPSTGLVEFNPEDPGFEDPRFGELANRSRVLVEFTRLLKSEFRPAGVKVPPYQFWTRKNLSERALVEAVPSKRM